MADIAKRDANFVPAIQGVSSADNTSPEDVQVNPVTGGLLIDIVGDDVGIGGGFQFAVDAAAGAADKGTLALAVRDDSLTTLTPADGDYTQLRVNSTGALYVTGGGGLIAFPR